MTALINKHKINTKIGERVSVLDITSKERYREGVVIALSENTVDLLMLDNGCRNMYSWKKIKAKTND